MTVPDASTSPLSAAEFRKIIAELQRTQNEILTQCKLLGSSLICLTLEALSLYLFLTMLLSLLKRGYPLIFSVLNSVLMVSAYLDLIENP